MTRRVVEGFRARGPKQLRAMYRNSSLRIKILILFSCLIVLTLLLVGITSFGQYSRASERRTREYSVQVIDQVIKNIDYFIQEMESISRFANYNLDIQDFLQNTSDPLQQDLANVFRNIEVLDNIAGLRSDIVSIFVVGQNGRVVSNSQNASLNPTYSFKDQTWFRIASANPDISVILKPHEQDYVVGGTKTVISLTRAITSYDSEEPLGVLLIDMNLETLDDICRNIQLEEGGYVFIVDLEGNMVYHQDYYSPNQSIVEMGIRDILPSEGGLVSDILRGLSGSTTQKVGSKDMQITYKRIASAGWVIVTVTPYSEIITEIIDIRDSVLFIGIICLLFAILFSFLISSAITRPLSDLGARMEAAEQGDLDVAERNYPTDEVGRLSRKMDDMLVKIKALMQEVVVEQESKRKSEMKALQAQINPHFLYNTLDSIVWMAETNNSQVIVMTEALARLFRIALSRGEDQITLEQELEHVRNYLIIQSIRYTNKFTYSIEAEEGLLQHKVLKLVIQPLVENSIYHGIKNMRQKGTIRIAASKRNGQLWIEITDDGVGMSAAKRATLLDPSERGGSGRLSGIGVRNVHDRIQLYYGSEYGLQFESEPGRGTTVRIVLPLLDGSGTTGEEGIRDDE